MAVRADDEMTRDSTGGSRPVPDPTVLTTQQLLREVLSLKELFNTRLEAMDKAIVLLQSNADKSPTIAVVDQRLTSAVCMMNSKFAEYDGRVEDMSKAATKAVDAAFAAQKEAITKSEAGFTKQIDNMGGQMHMLQKTLDDKISDIKDRLNGLSGLQIGTASGITAKEDSSKAMWVIIGIIGGVAASLVPVLTLFLNKGP
jgi:hypothetical protein